MTGTLDEILARVNALPAKERGTIEAAAREQIGRHRWLPNPGPQTDAYFSEADCLLFGGEPGGGKSQLLLGLAFNEHQRTMLCRREYADLERLIEDALTIHGSRDGFNGSPPPRLRINDRQTIYFRAFQRVGDEQGTMGQGRDLLAVDEATHFAESQIRFLMGWVRTEDPNQRCRTVLATNPPLTAEGLWVIDMFAPWLDDRYPNPAKHGELRWVITDENGKDTWVDGPGEYEITVNGAPKMVEATSRTYIPSSLSDNPDYLRSGYQKTIDAMPEPYRSLLTGGFKASFNDQPDQVIPTAWVKAAQRRWAERGGQPPPEVPMCAMGVDASGGGTDPMIIAPRHDGWFAPLIEVPGRDIPEDAIGRHCAGIIVANRRDGALVILDMGGGYGSAIYERLTDNNIEVHPYKGAAASTRRTSDRKLGFANMRSQAIWQFREALDPDQLGGSPIMLPDDNELTADLTAPTFRPTPHGIEVEAKEKVVKRLGRSTDKGDAVVMSWSGGARGILIRNVGQPEQRGPLRGVNANPDTVKMDAKTARRRDRYARR